MSEKEGIEVGLYRERLMSGVKDRRQKRVYGEDCQLQHKLGTGTMKDTRRSVAIGCRVAELWTSYLRTYMVGNKKRTRRDTALCTPGSSYTSNRHSQHDVKQMKTDGRSQQKSKMRGTRATVG
jgi:hypothetical protein